MWRDLETSNVFRSTRVSQGGHHSCQLCGNNSVGTAGAAADRLPLPSPLIAVLISDQVSGLKDRISLKDLQEQLPENPRHLENLTQDNYLGEWRSIPFRGCTSSHSLLVSHKQPGLGPLSLDRRPLTCSSLYLTLLNTLASAEGCCWACRTRLELPGTGSQEPVLLLPDHKAIYSPSHDHSSGQALRSQV